MRKFMEEKGFDPHDYILEHREELAPTASHSWLLTASMRDAMAGTGFDETLTGRFEGAWTVRSGSSASCSPTPTRRT